MTFADAVAVVVAAALAALLTDATKAIAKPRFARLGHQVCAVWALVLMVAAWWFVAGHPTDSQALREWFLAAGAAASYGTHAKTAVERRQRKRLLDAFGPEAL